MMSIMDLPMVRAIREKLKYHEQRQEVLAQNIANATTPDYRGRDLRTPDFFKLAATGDAAAVIVPVTTDRQHFPGTLSNRGHFRSEKQDGYEVTPDGNAVVLEEQMMKVADNQMDFQIATSLYQRSLALLKTAVGRR